MASRRPATVAMALAVLVMTAAAVDRAEAGQNCICECVKLCMRAHIPIPAMELCKGTCRENSCIKSCEEACHNKGFPNEPHEGIKTCEFEPLTADEQHMLNK